MFRKARRGGRGGGGGGVMEKWEFAGHLRPFSRTHLSQHQSLGRPRGRCREVLGALGSSGSGGRGGLDAQ